MTHPIENCPQPETEIRERAWTAEQAIANLLDRALDAAAFLNAIKMNDRAEPLREAVHAVWPESAKSMDARFHLSSAFAATLCQQAEQPAVAVSGWDGEAYANMAGELESWKRRALQAEHFIEHEVQGQTFMGEPLIQRPPAKWPRVYGTSRDADNAKCLLVSFATEPTDDELRAFDGAIKAALAQNTQGDAVAVVATRPRVDGYEVGPIEVSWVGDPPPAGTKLYLHAERASVPESLCAKPIAWSGPERGEWWDDRHGFHIGHDPDEDEPFVAAWGEGEPERFATLDEAKAWCQSEIDDWVRENVALAAAPSQPEDAGEVPRG